MALLSIKSYITNTPLYRGAASIYRGAKQKGLDVVPESVYSNDRVIKGIKKTGEKISSAEQRLILGASALMSQPFIDWNNKNVDEKTRKVSVARTVAKIIAGTLTGYYIRKGCIKGIKALSQIPGENVPKWKTIFTPKNVKDNNLKFLDTNYTIEDRPFLLECIILANKVYISKDLTYFYVQHNSSFVKSSNKLGFMQKSLNADFICKLILLKYNLYEDIKYKKLLVYRRTSLINDAKKIQKTLNIKYNLLVNQIERQLRLITNDLLYVYNTPWEKVVLNMNLEFSDKYKRLAKSTLVKDLRNYQ